jgi:hypothetical protein
MLIETAIDRVVDERLVGHQFEGKAMLDSECLLHIRHLNWSQPSNFTQVPRRRIGSPSSHCQQYQEQDTDPPNRWTESG